MAFKHGGKRQADDRCRKQSQQRKQTGVLVGITKRPSMYHGICPLGNGVLTWKLRTPLSLVITAVSPRIPALIRGESRSLFSFVS
ncbi:Uncharacterised protein [Raoultella ornithinolytica]|nr:Uncharacterised protein [Raoultella ornithinolytica]